MKHTYIVYGETGPVASDFIERRYKTKSAKKAVKKFVKEMKKHHPVQWARMGMSNVYFGRIMDKRE